jgi:integrase
MSWSRQKKDRAPRGVFVHPSGQWAIRFSCGLRHVHQEQVSRTKRDAIDLHAVRRLRARQDPGWCPVLEREQAHTAASRHRLTFAEYAADYLGWSTTVHRSRKTPRGEVARLVAAWGALPLDDVTTAEVERLLMGLQTGASPLSPSTVNRYRDRVSGMFKRALRLGLVARNPATGIPKHKEPGGRVLYLLPLEESAIRDALAPAMRPAFTLSLHTGLRWSEQAALTWRDVDVLTSMIGIGRSKNGYGRRVPVNAVVRSVLVDLASQRRRPEDPDEPVFNLAYRTVARAIERAVAHAQAQLRDAGQDASRLDGYSWHGNRHTFASRLVMAGVDLRTVAELGGWRTLSMVQRYAHLSPGHLAAAVERLVPGSDAGVELRVNFNASGSRREPTPAEVS